MTELSTSSSLNNKFFTPNEFNHALQDLVNRKYAPYITSKHHHYLTTIKNYISLYSMKTKPKIMEISERLQIISMNTHQLNLVKGDTSLY